MGTKYIRLGNIQKGQQQYTYVIRRRIQEVIIGEKRKTRGSFHLWRD